MSSSSALLVLCFSILSRANALNEREEYRREISRDLDLSGYLGTIENGQSFGGLTGDRGVGTFGGSEDHTAILRSRAGRLSQYSYCPVRFERDLELPPQYVFAIGVSGVIAQKSAGAREQFNRASALLGAVLRVWRERTGRSDASVADAIRGGGVDQVRALLDSSQDAEFSPRELRDRFDQFYAESEQIIPVAGDALLAGDLNAFGAAVARSQNLGSRLLANTVPQTDRLAEIAIELGAAAASCFGAGFGGSVWAIVRASEADAFNAAWLERYAVQFPQEASRSSFFTTGPGPAAMEL
jgi:galactokinase